MPEKTNPMNFIGKRVTVRIDRPLDSRHPEHGFVYEANYGYVPGTLAPDGEELDAYVLGIEKPLEKFTGVCIAVIRRKDDEDDKLVVAPEGKHLSDKEIKRMTRFQERFFSSEIIRKP